MYLDTDDLISLNKIENQIKTIKQGGEIAVCPWARFYDDIDDARYEIRITDGSYENGRELLIDMWNNASSVSMIACHSYLVSRELIAKSGGWNEQLTANDDGEFFARILLCCGKVLFAESAYAYYRTGRYSCMSRTISRRNVESHLESYRLHIKNALPIDSSIQMRRLCAIIFLISCIYITTHILTWWLRRKDLLLKR